MYHEVQQSHDCEFDWLVSAVNDEVGERDRGEIYIAVFSGAFAEERAREYADWKNGKRLEPVAA